MKSINHLISDDIINNLHAANQQLVTENLLMLDENRRLRTLLKALITHPAVREVLAPRDSLGSLLAQAEEILEQNQ